MRSGLLADVSVLSTFVEKLSRPRNRHRNRHISPRLNRGGGKHQQRKNYSSRDFLLHSSSFKFDKQTSLYNGSFSGPTSNFL